MSFKLTYMKRLLILIASILLVSSCFPLVDDTPKNDNYKLYNTEWSTESQQEGLKFFKDDSVMYFSSYNKASSTYEYSESDHYIIFDNLIATFPSFTSEMPLAEMQADGTMKLYWHELGKTENYYMILYRRR